MPTYLIIVIIVTVFALMGVVKQSWIKRKSPFWGLIIPVLIGCDRNIFLLFQKY